MKLRKLFLLFYLLQTSIESRVYTGFSQGLFPKVLGGTISGGYQTWLYNILASVNPKTETQELVVSGTTYDSSFHLLPTMLSLGIPFITLIDELSMKIVWSKAYDTRKLISTSAVHYKMTSLAVSSNHTQIAGLTSNTGSLNNYLFILDRTNGATLQLRSLSTSLHYTLYSNFLGKGMLIFDGDYIYAALVNLLFKPLLIQIDLRLPDY